MTEKINLPSQLQRLPTGIAGLDAILKGGAFTGGHYLVMGVPGTGKTILGNQLCFEHVARGGRVLYVSLLAETHSRLLTFLQSMTFFTPSPIGDALYYLSGSAMVEREGLEGLLSLLRTETRHRRATLVLLDGTVMIEASQSPHEWLHFLHALYVSAEIQRCTTVLLAQPRGTLIPEQTIADGVIELTMSQVGLRTVREVQVHKHRGSSFLEGRHLYTINETGLIVYPRTEAQLIATPSAFPAVASAPEPAARMSLGIDRLDEMLQGGLPAGSTTLLLGASGTGKTLLGSHFLMAGTKEKHPGLYFGFSETPQQMARKLARFGLDTTCVRTNGLLELLWQSPVQDLLDVLAERLFAAIERLGARRLFIDGVGGFRRTVTSTERLDLFLIALFTALQEREVTTICSVEMPNLFSPTVELPAVLDGAAALADNLIFLRYVELESQLYRLLSVMKMRESGYDSAIREFRITDQGMDVAATFASAQAILTGIARPGTTPRGATRDDSAREHSPGEPV